MKRSITKRFTCEAHREVPFDNVARPRRVKAYRAVRSCLVGGGVSGHTAKGSAPGRSWLKTIGCVCCIRSRRAHNRPVEAAPVRSPIPVNHGGFGLPGGGRGGPSRCGRGRGRTGPDYRPMCCETREPRGRTGVRRRPPERVARRSACRSGRHRRARSVRRSLRRRSGVTPRGDGPAAAWPTGTGCGCRRAVRRGAWGRREKQDGRRCSTPPRPVYDTSGIAIPDSLGHAPCSVAHAFAGVWAVEV